MPLHKRAIEHSQVAAFLSSVAIEADIEPQRDGHGPDFLVRGSRSTFGIEHTRLYRQPEPGHPPRRQLEGVRDQVLRRAASLWREQMGVPVEVHCRFDLRHLPEKGAISATAERLVSWARAHLPAEGGYTSFDRDWREPDILPRSILGVAIYRGSLLVDAHWAAPDGDWVPTLDPTHVQARIDAKAAKFATYAERAPEVWLLIVLEGGRLSGTFTVAGAATEHQYRSPFARTYLFETFSRAPTLLRCAA